MTHGFARAAGALALILAASACSSGSDTDNGAMPANIAEPVNVTNAANSAVPEAQVSKNVIGLEGLGDLRIGEAVPAGSTWAERGAQVNEACRTISSPDYPGVYAIVSNGKVKRITVGQRSEVKLAEGIGVGATEADVRKWFAGFREEPHKYETPPAKYLTAPNASTDSSALRLEIGQAGTLMMIHVGLMPELAYVEGCA